MEELKLVLGKRHPKKRDTFNIHRTHSFIGMSHQTVNVNESWVLAVTKPWLKYNYTTESYLNVNKIPDTFHRHQNTICKHSPDQVSTSGNQVT